LKTNKASSSIWYLDDNYFRNTRVFFVDNRWFAEYLFSSRRRCSQRIVVAAAVVVVVVAVEAAGFAFFFFLIS
jgi:hypothetical protein